MKLREKNLLLATLVTLERPGKPPLVRTLLKKDFKYKVVRRVKRPQVVVVYGFFVKLYNLVRPFYKKYIGPRFYFFRSFRAAPLSWVHIITVTVKKLFGPLYYLLKNFFLWCIITFYRYLMQNIKFVKLLIVRDIIRVDTLYIIRFLYFVIKESIKTVIGWPKLLFCIIFDIVETILRCIRFFILSISWGFIAYIQSVFWGWVDFFKVMWLFWWGQEGKIKVSVGNTVRYLPPQKAQRHYEKVERKKIKMRVIHGKPFSEKIIPWVERVGSYIYRDLLGRHKIRRRFAKIFIKHKDRFLPTYHEMFLKENAIVLKDPRYIQYMWYIVIMLKRMIGFDSVKDRGYILLMRIIRKSVNRIGINNGPFMIKFVCF